MMVISMYVDIYLLMSTHYIGTLSEQGLGLSQLSVL